MATPLERSRDYAVTFCCKNEKRKKLQTRFIPLVSFSATHTKLAYFLCKSAHEPGTAFARRLQRVAGIFDRHRRWSSYVSVLMRLLQAFVKYGLHAHATSECMTSPCPDHL
ncbi:hypothetical protein [Comamonas jiangduensis]|uniref:hypothetical protein n=1 Tax=Comamonas jiangduensis TaxID=1194168 RepID=UPI003BF874EA